MKKSVLLIFGGCSTEYAVSCNGAASMMEHIDTEKYNLITVGITQEGEWLYTESTPEEIRDGKTWIKSDTNKSAYLLPDKVFGGLLVVEENNLNKISVDCVFPLIHGENGEDGSLQGLFELSGIPYVGSNVLSSACSLDKSVTRIFADSINMKQVDCVIVNREDYDKDKEQILKTINTKLNKYPLFIKPASSGSSIGVYKINNSNEILEHLEAAFQYDDIVLVEEGIIGKEIKVALLENGEVEAGSICELIIKGDAFNDFETKYKDQSAIKTIPANISPELKEHIENQAIAIFKRLGCRAYARVDFFLDNNNELYFNEINTIPGLAKESIFSVMLEDKGVPYSEIISKLIESSDVKGA